MNTNVSAASIAIFESERRYMDEGLDFEYIDRAAREIGGNLRARFLSVDIAYQPGDGTFYGLVFTPLHGLVSTPPRVVNGTPWDARAVRGLEYEDGNFLVSWVEHRAYPIRLKLRHKDLAASYVAEHWDTTMGSAVSLALLFRAVSWHLDNLENPQQEGERT